MKNQKGFSLVELMVVMFIITILSTAGISQYGKFIKGARDTTRVADLNALNIVILDSIQSDGTVPEDADALMAKIKEVAGKDIRDPLDGKEACLDADAAPVTCTYKYSVCDGGTGYTLATSFESTNNTENKYTKDDVSTSDDGDYTPDDDLYELGTCNNVDSAYEDITSA